MYDLPVKVTLNETDYAIRNRGDYRMVLDCFSVLNDIELTEQERICASLIIFYENFNTLEDVLSADSKVVKDLVEEAFTFFNCGQKNPPIAETNFKAIDWDNDSQLISSAINKVAGFEVRSVEYIHWWTFLGYFSAVGESPLSTVVGIRSKIAKGKKLEKYEMDFRRDNPQYFVWDMRTLQQKEEDELINQLWNKE